MVQAGTIGSLEFFLDEGSNRLLNRRYHSDSDVEGAMWNISGPTRKLHQVRVTNGLYTALDLIDSAPTLEKSISPAMAGRWSQKLVGQPLRGSSRQWSSPV